MRSFILVTVLVCLSSTAIGRPPTYERDQGEVEEAEYDNNEESPIEESVQEEEDLRLNEEEPRDVSRNEVARSPMTGRERPYSLHRPERADRSENEHLMEYSRKLKEDKIDEEGAVNEVQTFKKRRHSNRYMDSVDDAPDNEQRLRTNYRENRAQSEPRSTELGNTQGTAALEDDLIFDNQKDHRNNGEKVEYNNDVVDSAEQARHYKQYYNNLQPEHRNKQGDRGYEMAKFVNRDRDRRQADQTDSLSFSSTSTEKESVLSDNVNEDDEAAIKRHIKKLSGDELEELLNSLSDDKKALLNKIMENNSDALNKREISKKAEAVEENNYIDSGVSELTKNQGISPAADINTESAIAQSSDTENTKQESQTESSDTTNSKTSEGTRGDAPDSKAELSNSVEETSNNIKLDVNLKPNEDAKMSAKIENKREANSDLLKNQDESLDDAQFLDNYHIKDLDDSFNDENHYCSPQEKDLSQLTDDEMQLHKDYKREAFFDNQVSFDDSIRSLEESFPNGNCEDSSADIGSNMAPLVRVKRKDEEIIKKRDSGILPNAKVAYVPYKAENDDEDNDEGSEFDDDGFFDRTSNYAKSNVNKPDDGMACDNYARESEDKSKLSNIDKLSDASANDKVHSDTMSLGTDTDSVLSGVEGVDENLMYSNGSRNRRTLDGNLDQSDVGTNKLLHSTPSAEDGLKPSDNVMDIPNYQEKDAFGALPKNYDNELARYKRIRRVKPSTFETSSDN